MALPLVVTTIPSITVVVQEAGVPRILSTWTTHMRQAPKALRVGCQQR